MKRDIGLRPREISWATILTVSLIVIIMAVSGYTSYAVYGSVRDYVAHSLNLPSFEVLSRQAGLSVPESASVPTQDGSGQQTEPGPVGSGEEQELGAAEGMGSQERVNILLLGIDQREGEQGPFRTDTMIVLTIAPSEGTVGMLSIPRDLWVPIPGFAENRINTAHVTGDLYDYPGGGPALAKKTVSYNLGFPVHYYVRVNFDGFKEIIDTIGGVDIDVPREIYDEEYPDENYGYAPLYIPAGYVHMDGELALKYARTRKTDNDFYRSSRQQQVILAVKDKVMDLNLLPSLLPRLPELSRQLSDTIETDMPMEEIVRLAKLARTMDLNNIKTVVIDQTMTAPARTPSGAEVLLPLRDSIRPVVDDLFWSSLPTVPPAQ